MRCTTMFEDQKARGCAQINGLRKWGYILMAVGVAILFAAVCT